MRKMLSIISMLSVLLMTMFCISEAAAETIEEEINTITNKIHVSSKS